VHACTQKIILVFVCGTYVPTLAYLWYLVCVSGMSVRPYPPHHMGRTQLCDDFFHTHLEIFLSILFWPFVLFVCIFYSEIDDHGVRRGDTGQILALWRRPVASRAALYLPYRAMHAVSHRNIAMTIKMTSEGGEFFAIVIFFVVHNHS
jgi:hypothetical protein